MQVGEPISVAAVAASPPEVEFAAELVSVRFKTPVKTSHTKAEIVGPHWEVGKEPEIDDDWGAQAKKMRLPVEVYYSRRAAVYLVKRAGKTWEVEVKVKVTKSKNVSGDAKLEGHLRGLSIEGTCPTAAGEHTITAKITDPPDSIQAYRGKIAWALAVESAGISANLGTTLAEVYFILGQPTTTPYHKGVWVEVLRFLCGRVGVRGETDAQRATQRITTYCHSQHSLHYNTRNGGARYGVGTYGGTFKLADYMLRLKKICNCYDQAAAVQALSAALGVRLLWLYLSPFGFIKPTNLVGVGECNNPFFMSNGSERLVAVDSPDRTAFGNHAFVGSGTGNILDACAGPHIGREPLPEYLESSIDDTPSIYRWGFRAGRVSDIVPGRGVRDVK
jgi:hypothetical protein